MHLVINLRQEEIHALCESCVLLTNILVTLWSVKNEMLIGFFFSTLVPETENMKENHIGLIKSTPMPVFVSKPPR